MIEILKAINIANEIGFRAPFDVYEFRKGLEVEMEHIDSVGGDMLAIGRIVNDHLREDPMYYTNAEKTKRSYAGVSESQDFNVVCSYCKQPYKYKSDIPKDMISHGVCPSCEHIPKDELEEWKKSRNNPGKPYVGVLKDKDYTYEVFWYHVKPTDETHGDKYRFVTGPFTDANKAHNYALEINEKHLPEREAVRKSFAKSNPSDIQSFRFERKSWTPTRAKAWAKKRGYKYGDMYFDSRFIILRQYDDAPDLEYKLKKLGKKKGLYALYRIYGTKDVFIKTNPSDKIQLSDAEPISINPGVPLPPGFLPKRQIPGHSLTKRRIEQEMSLRQRYHPSKAVLFDEYFGKGQSAVETLMEGSELESENKEQTVSYVSSLIQKTVERRVLKLNGSVLFVQIPEDSIGFRPPEEGSGLLWGIYRVGFRDGSRSAGRFSIEGRGDWDRFHFYRVRLN